MGMSHQLGVLTIPYFPLTKIYYVLTHSVEEEHQEIALGGVRARDIPWKCIGEMSRGILKLS